MLDRLGRTVVSDRFDSTTSREQSDHSPEAGSLGPFENNPDRQGDQTPGHTTEHNALLEPAENSPRLDRGSPSGFPLDDREVGSVDITVPAFSAFDLPYSTRYGIDSARVCQPLLIPKHEFCADGDLS